MLITSPAFEQHQPIPQKYTCQGEDLSPPLQFQDAPAGTKSLALIMDDPDAPMGTFVHWVVWNLPPDTRQLSEGVKLKHQEGKNHFPKIGYGGPCPPPGKPHRYYFKLYALDTQVHLSDGSSKEQLLEAMEGHILGQAELVGTYQRKP